MIDIVIAGVLMGVVATVAMDIWALVLTKCFNQTFPNWAMVGRWVAHLKRGAMFHKAIGDAEPVSGELRIGWAFHYAVGVIYGIALAAFMGSEWLAEPSFLPAWVFSVLTVGFGWFLLQPGMGLGWAASKTPNPWKVRALNLIAHTVFALGLWLGAVVMSA